MRLSIASIFICLSILSCGQGFKSKFLLPNCSNNSAHAIFEISHNNYLAAGMSVDTSDGIQTNCIVMIGLDSAGKLKWEKRYGVSSLTYYENGFVSKYFNRIGNNIYYTGAAQDTGMRTVGVLIKFDLNGDTIWQKIYRNDDPAEDVIPQGMCRSVDGGFLMTGFWRNWITNISPCLLIKTDATGKELWRKKISSNYGQGNFGMLVQQDSASKRIVIVGAQYVGTALKDNNIILDSLGKTISQHLYAPLGGWPTDLIQTKDKKFLVTGRSVQAETLGGDNLNQPFVAKFDINAPMFSIWTVKKLGVSAFHNFFHSAVELENGDVMLGGIYDSARIVDGTTNILTRLTRIDKNGKILRNRCYNYRAPGANGPNEAPLLMISPLKDGGFVAAIKLINFPNPNPMFFVKFDSTGCDSTLDYCATLVSTVNVPVFVEESFGMKIYPNPVNGYLNIKREDAFRDKVTEISICDILGKEVYRGRLENETKIITQSWEPGLFIISFIEKDVPVHFYKIIKN